MGNIFTRKALSDIMANEGLTPEQRTEQVMSLYGRALDDGYVSRSAAQTAQETAIANAKTEWEKSITKPDPTESDEYKALRGEFDAYRAMQTARSSDDYKGVKGKFFETVYGMIDRRDGAKPVAEQMKDIRANWGEYFDSDDAVEHGKDTPQYSRQPGHPGVNPTTDEDKIFKEISDSWK